RPSRRAGRTRPWWNARAHLPPEGAHANSRRRAALVCYLPRDMRDLVVLFGGPSSERKVSVASAQNVASLLEQAEAWFWAAGGESVRQGVGQARGRRGGGPHRRLGPPAARRPGDDRECAARLPRPSWPGGGEAGGGRFERGAAPRRLGRRRAARRGRDRHLGR